MTPIITTLLILAVIGVVAYFFVTTRRQPAAPPEPEPASVDNLQPRDVVRYSMEPDRHYVVTGYIDYSASGYTWREYRLAAGSDIRWLEVGYDDGALEITLWQVIEMEIPLQGEPASAIEHAGRRYTLKEADNAVAIIVGETGQRSSASCRYWEYTAGGDQHRLAIEQWGGEREVCLGERVHREQLEIFPAAAEHAPGGRL